MKIKSARTHTNIMQYKKFAKLKLSLRKVLKCNRRGCRLPPGCRAQIPQTRENSSENA